MAYIRRHSAGSFPRHAAIIDITKRALDAAGFHSVLEPVNLDRGDGRRPDGITVFPFRRGKALVWDATCTDTFAPSDLFFSATNPGSAYIAAEVRNHLKYPNLTQDYFFVPVVETSLLIGPDASSHFHEIGRKISRERRSISYVFFISTPLNGHRQGKCILNDEFCHIRLSLLFLAKL